jgi:uncharacterized membrane protein
LLPDLTSVVGTVEFLTRLAVVAGPIVLLVLGILYLFLSPKEANYHFGYRCFFGMGSPEAWCFTQRFAGIVWAALGLILTIVMTIITTGFDGKPVMYIVASGLRCLLWEIILTVLSCLIINLVVMFRYDRNGLLRKS